MSTYAEFHARSLADRDGFWAEQAVRIDWQRPFDAVCDTSRPPFADWFVGGTTNLCHNAVDRHLAERAGQNALIWVSTETGQEKVYSFADLHAEVQGMAACLQALGVGRGDRVLIYLPMIPEAVFAMLACARIGAIHCVVFGGFASGSLASRIDDAEPTLIVSADAGSRAGKVVAYKPLLDAAIDLASAKPSRVLLIDRGLARMARVAGRDVDHAPLRERHRGAAVPCEWLASTDPSCLLYTSGTTGRPKGVQRDTGGYAVALAASMTLIFGGRPGETFFCTSDIGWVVGHSYIVYGPLLAGMATILYEGLPTRPDAGIWWQLVEKYRVGVVFSAPTAIRVLKRQDPSSLRRHDLRSLRALFLAGEPLDEPTARWIAEALGKPVIDNYWQTESGWPILTVANGVVAQPSRFGSPGFAMYGYDVRLVDEATGDDITEPDRKGVLCIAGPLPPGCLQTVWRDDARFLSTYWSGVPGRELYSTFDWAVRDAEGYHFILGRTDDVINVAGHRLGTREIEESIASHPNVAEVAVVGVADALKGQVAMAFVVARDAAGLSDPAARLALAGDIMRTVDGRLGGLARPARVHFVGLLPKTRSGKMLRRAVQAVCERRDPGDLTTLDDPTALEQIRAVLQADGPIVSNRMTEPDAADTPLSAAASDPDLLGWMQGAPPPPERQVRFDDGGMYTFPKSRWAFSHIAELVPTKLVPRGDGPVAVLPRADRDDIDAVRFTPIGGASTLSWAESLDANYTDGIVVLHRGRIVHERYFGALASHRPHLAWSVTKSFFGLIATSLIEEGRLDPAAPVSAHVPELAASGLGDATVRQVLDMTTSLACSEDYADPDAGIWAHGRAGGILPRRVGDDGPASFYEFLVTLRAAGPHDEAFAYKTVNTDALGWILRRVTGVSLATLLDQRLWSRLGAEHDAHLMIDATGTEFVGAGLNCALRDLARFGEMLRQDGRWLGRQVVPKAAIDDIRRGADPAKFVAAGYTTLPGASYRAMWWVLHDEHGAYCARGIHGQGVYVDPAAEMVIARFASHPKAGNVNLDPTTLPAYRALAKHLLRG